MGIELRNDISYVENQIEAHQRVLAELKEHQEELNSVLTQCYHHGLPTHVNFHIRPNCTLVESDGVTVRVFDTATVDWEGVMGRFNSSTIFRRDTLKEIIQHLRDRVLSNPFG